MQAGKLPPKFLSSLLSKVETMDHRVVLGPTPGEDAALIDFGDRLVVAKTDPITFATEFIGCRGEPGELKHLSTQRKRKQKRFRE